MSQQTTPQDARTSTLTDAGAVEQPTPPNARDTSDGSTESPPGLRAPRRATDDAQPRLAEGVELLGRYEDSGYKQPPYMARRPDGQMLQLPPILYLISELADGNRSYDQIGSAISHRIQRGLDADGVRLLVEEKLRPLGVVAGPDGRAPGAKKADPLLALRLRAKVVPQGAVNTITAGFKPLFLPLFVVLLLGTLIAVDVWLFFIHGVAQSLREMLYQPLYMILTFGLIVIAAAFHEIGHATACKFSGASPGVMGVGIYVVWPAFYTDVTDAYRLRKSGRLRTDFGGVYFNCIFILATYAAFVVTGFEPLLLLMFIQHMEMFRQLLPILRFDGYYVLSDATGVPDLFGRIGAILKSMLPWNWRKHDPRVHQLKPWVRGVVTMWVLVLVPFLAFNFLMMLTYAPRIVATGWDSFWLQWDKTTGAFGEGSALAGAAGIIQMVTLALPAVGMVYSFSRMGTRVSTKAWRSTEGKPIARTGVVLAMGAAVALLALVWWPDGDFKPAQPSERWTVPEAWAAMRATALGRPAFDHVEDGSVSEGTVGLTWDEEGPTHASTVGPTEEPTDEPTGEPADDTTTAGETEEPTEEPTEETTEPSPEPSETTDSTDSTTETSRTAGAPGIGGVTDTVETPEPTPIETPTG